MPTSSVGASLNTLEDDFDTYIPEVRLLAAIVARSVQDYACPLTSREAWENSRAAWLYFYSDLSAEMPFSFRWVLSHLFPDRDVEESRRQIIDRCEAIRNHNRLATDKIISWKGFFIRRTVRQGKKKDVH